MFALICNTAQNQIISRQEAERDQVSIAADVVAGSYQSKYYSSYKR